MIESFRALIIDGDVQARVRLKETLRSVTYRNDIRMVRSLREAEGALSYGEGFDGVFIASEHQFNAVLDLVRRARQTQPGRRAFYVIVLKVEQQKSTYMAGLYLSGIDGFIQEPFVASELQSTLETLIQEKVKKIENEERKRTALNILISDAISGIDQRVKELLRTPAGTTAGGYTMRELRSACAQIQVLAKEVPELYEEVMIEKFEAVPPPRENVFRKKKKKKREKMQHPGEAVGKMLEDRGLNKDVVAARLGLNEAEFEQLLNGERRVDEELAKKLSHILGNTPGFWIHLQNMCEARKKEFEQEE